MPKTTDRDLGYTKILQEVDKIKRRSPSVDAGIFGRMSSGGKKSQRGKRDAKGRFTKNIVSPKRVVSIAMYAFYNEFGSKKIPNHPPARSFLRSTFDENQKKYDQMAKQGVIAITEGKESIEGLLFKIGNQMRTDIIKKIKSNVPPTLAESTKEAKGGSKALIDSGAMWNAIRHRMNLDSAALTSSDRRMANQ